MIRATYWNGVGGQVRDLGGQQRFLLAAWLALQSLDILTTALGLRTGLREANLIAAHGFARFGEFTVFGFKALLAVALAAVIIQLSPRYPKLWLGLRLINCYMILAVSFNLLNIVLGA